VDGPHQLDDLLAIVLVLALEVGRGLVAAVEAGVAGATFCLSAR